MKLLVITGGRHPYEESTPVLERFLKSAGHDVTVSEDASVLADAAGMAAYDALVFNTRRENAADFAEMKLSEGEQKGIIDYVKSGKGFVCLHISGCGADYWSEFAEITGGGWVSGTSFHPPYGNVAVKVTEPGHAGVAGVSLRNAIRMIRRSRELSTATLRTLASRVLRLISQDVSADLGTTTS